MARVIDLTLRKVTLVGLLGVWPKNVPKYALRSALLKETDVLDYASAIYLVVKRHIGALKQVKSVMIGLNDCTLESIAVSFVAAA